MSVNLQQSGRRIPDAWSIKLKFSLTITFYPTQLKNKRAQQSLTQLSYYCFKWCYFCQKLIFFFAKKMQTSAKLWRPLRTKFQVYKTSKL